MTAPVSALLLMAVADPLLVQEAIPHVILVFLTGYNSIYQALRLWMPIFKSHSDVIFGRLLVLYLDVN